MSFVRFFFLIQRFGGWVFGEFYRSANYVRNFPRSTHMFICWRARTRAQIKSWKRDSSKNLNDPVRRRRRDPLDAMIFELLR